MADSFIPGAPKTEIQELPVVRDRYTFIYLERCVLRREDSALKAEFGDQYTLIPSHAFLVIMLGPGTSVTHQAIELAGESGLTMVWVGEGAARFYACGKPLTASSNLLISQAKCVSSNRLRMKAVRTMYAMRFPDEDFSDLTLQQMRGKEGARVRAEYKRQSEMWNVPWNGRSYKAGDYTESDDVNKALSIANSCLYAIAQAVVTALGLSPGLGFIHTGHERSFIYDLTDLYKADYSIPVAFEVASEKSVNIFTAVRKKMRDSFQKNNLVERMVSDIRKILSVPEDENIPDFEDTMVLWDGVRGFQPYGKSYRLPDIEKK